MLKQDFKVFVMHLSNVSSGEGGGGLLFSRGVGWGKSRDLIYLSTPPPLEENIDRPVAVHHNLVQVNYPDPELLGQFHERDAWFEKLLAEAVLNEHSPLK